MKGGATMLRASTLVVVTVLLTVQVAADNTTYKACHTGDGKAHLYNCGPKFDHYDDKIAQLESITSPTRFMVKLRKSVPVTKVDEICSVAETNKTAYPGYCVTKYKSVWVGMLMVLTGQNLAKLLDVQKDEIEYVEVEGTVRTSGVISTISVTPTNVTQTYPQNWGLDRIDHQAGQPLLNNLYTVASGGDGVHVYIIDTGVRCSHKEFLYQDGRLDANKKPMTRCFGGFDGIQDGSGTNDCNGHGTHCAGVVGGLQSGVAKNAFIHPVRALGCDGSGGYGTVMAALDWIGWNAVYPAVISMSLASPASISIDQAVQQLVLFSGITTLGAAGNFHEDACHYSPARIPTVMTVAASSATNTESWFSNFGACANIFAPGELITSSWNTTDTAFNTLSGTSMACPHVAGAVALYLAQFGDVRPKDMMQYILDAAEPTAVSGIQPNTSTKLINVANLKPPIVSIKPRNWYGIIEGTSHTCVVSLQVKPTSIVMLLPVVAETNCGYFTPNRLYFANDATWSVAQTLTLTLYNQTDFFDHGSPIFWIFTSQDPRFNLSPEGSIMGWNSEVCRATPANPCGQTFQNPIVIPRLPFDHIDNSMLYQNVYDTSMDYCHYPGSDVVYQYTPTSNMKLMVYINNTVTDIDILLSLYEKITQANNVTKLGNIMGCADVFLGSGIQLGPVSLKANHTYVIMVDGWALGGVYEIFVYDAANATYIPAYGANNVPLPKGLNVKLTASSLATTACTQWNSLMCSQDVPPPSPPQNSNFWSAAYWGACTKTCGGGTQDAVIKCYIGNYTEIDPSGCDLLIPPKISRDCNVMECKSYALFEGPWSECNRTCGSGMQTRMLMCVDNLGNTAHPQQCAPHYELALRERPCNIQACNTTFWDVPKWGFCNIPCGGGRRVRDAICRNATSIVDEAKCSKLPPSPPTDQTCNSHPCQTYAWLVGPWIDCPVGCNATQTRLVECVDGAGVTSDVMCDLEIKPPSSIACQRSNMTCNNCLQNNCSGHGSCSGGQCVCSGDWEGIFCDRLKKCKGRPIGYVGGKVGCCPHQMIDMDHRCCLTANAALSSNGLCCEGGALDACGQCNGTAISIDSQSTCCTTVRDEKGICCKSGVMDECHVCDGDGTSCATNITVSLIFNSDVQMPHNTSNEWKQFMYTFIQNVASKLGLAPEAFLLTSVRLSNSYNGKCTEEEDRSEGCLLNGSPEVIGTFNITLVPKPAVQLGGMVVRKSEMLASIASIQFPSASSEQVAPMFGVTPSSTNNQPIVTVQSVDNVQKVGICGNGVCEQGERCEPDNRSAMNRNGFDACCLADCPYVATGCPMAISGPNAQKTCSNRGVCLDATGQCKCYTGLSHVCRELSIITHIQTELIRDFGIRACYTRISAGPIEHAQLAEECYGRIVSTSDSTDNIDHWIGLRIASSGYMGTACEQCMLGWSPTSDMKSCLKLASVQEVLAMGLASDNPIVGEDEMVTESPSGGINFLTVVIMVSLLSVVAYCMFHWWKNRTQPPEHRHHRLSTDAGDQNNNNTNAPISRGGGSNVTTRTPAIELAQPSGTSSWLVNRSVESIGTQTLATEDNRRDDLIMSNRPPPLIFFPPTRREQQASTNTLVSHLQGDSTNNVPNQMMPWRGGQLDNWPPLQRPIAIPPPPNAPKATPSSPISTITKLGVIDFT